MYELLFVYSSLSCNINYVCSESCCILDTLVFHEVIVQYMWVRMIHEKLDWTDSVILCCLDRTS